jgi:hypothetical protein
MKWLIVADLARTRGSGEFGTGVLVIASLTALIKKGAGTTKFE